ALEKGDAPIDARTRKTLSSLASKSPLFRAALLLLDRREAGGKPGRSLVRATADPLKKIERHPPQAPPPKHHQALPPRPSEKIAALGKADDDALVLLALGHLEEILSLEGALPGPAILARAHLAQGPATGLWGPSASVGRLEIARFLARPPAVGIARAVQ